MGLDFHATLLFYFLLSNQIKKNSMERKINMFKYVLKRVLTAIPIFLIITAVVYLLLSMAPGNAVDSMASSAQMSQEEIEQLRASYGLDKPVIVRYVDWLINFLHGDWGTSYSGNQSVSHIISQRIISSLVLTCSGMLLAIIIGIPLGILAGTKPYSVIDNFASAVAYIGTAIPSFFLSLAVIYIVALQLGLTPTQGMYTPGQIHTISDLLKHLILPASMVAIQLVGGLIKQSRNGMMEVLNEEYVKTARSKGIGEGKVIVKHAFRNTLAPIITQITLSVPYLIGGAVVTEQIFSWPGLGSLMVTSITNRDYPVVMGITVLVAIVVLVANIISDLVYAALDPRVKFE